MPVGRKPRWIMLPVGSHLICPAQDHTVESLRVASYDAGRALRATKSIIAFLCENLPDVVVVGFVGSGKACI